MNHITQNQALQIIAGCLQKKMVPSYVPVWDPRMVL